jgi:hypothetical protein
VACARRTAALPLAEAWSTHLGSADSLRFGTHFDAKVLQTSRISPLIVM